ncbi:MAG: ribosome silencing factor [Planctomycetia bacterium]|nr:ribosome silencing factor [Planctomycetia bacterium]
MTRKSQKASANLPDAKTRALRAAQIIQEMKGLDIKVLDLRELTQTFDFFVIASGSSRRQLHAISEEIDNVFEKELGDVRRSICGYQESLWIVLDYEDVVVHLFEPEKREFYALEDLWGKAIDVPVPALVVPEASAAAAESVSPTESAAPAEPASV